MNCRIHPPVLQNGTHCAGCSDGDGMKMVTVTPEDFGKRIPNCIFCSTCGDTAIAMRRRTAFCATHATDGVLEDSSTLMLKRSPHEEPTLEQNEYLHREHMKEMNK